MKGCRLKILHFLLMAKEVCRLLTGNGELIGLQVGKVSSLFNEVRDAVLEEGISLELALQVITLNPANVLKLANKGRIQEGTDADIVLLDKETLEIDSVIAKGKVMVKNKVPIVKGTFE